MTRESIPYMTRRFASSLIDTKERGDETVVIDFIANIITKRIFGNEYGIWIPPGTKLRELILYLQEKFDALTAAERVVLSWGYHIH